MNAVQAAVYSARSALESAGIASAKHVWLHTSSSGPCLRVHVEPGKAILAARQLKGLNSIVPIWIEEREHVNQGEVYE